MKGRNDLEDLELNAESQPDESAEATTPENLPEVFVPIKFNKEVKNLKVSEAAVLAQKGLKFESIEEDYGNLKKIASSSGKSVAQFLLELEKSEALKRKEELTEKCGGNEEMADYVLGLEKGREEICGFEELQREFPEIKDISSLPQSVVENAQIKGTLLLDEYLRYRHTEKKNARKSAANSASAENSSIGSQTDRRGGTDPEALEFLKGLWR